MSTIITIRGRKIHFGTKPTKADAKQDKLFREAVKLAIKRQKLMGQPVARYDKVTGKVYMEYPDEK